MLSLGSGEPGDALVDLRGAAHRLWTAGLRASANDVRARDDAIDGSRGEVKSSPRSERRATGIVAVSTRIERDVEVG